MSIPAVIKIPVAIGIIGVLAAVIVPQMKANHDEVEKSKTTQAASSVPATKHQQ